MNTVILHNRITDNPSPDELDVLEQVRSVSDALDDLGHSVTFCPFDLDCLSVKTAFLKHRPDMVFNLVESVDGKGSLVNFAPALLETMRIPFTGSSSEAMFVTSNKILAKKLLVQAGLRTPSWFHPGLIGTDASDTAYSGKWIIKSLWEHASIGMDDSSVIQISNISDLTRAIAFRVRKYGGQWFAERFIEGREFNIGLLGGDSGVDVLPPAEILFRNFVQDKPRIVDYRAKWMPASEEYMNTSRCFDFHDNDTILLKELNNLALHCWQVFQLQGYARVDFRVDSNGTPWILEINANPCLSEDAGYAAAVERSGLMYMDAIRRILEDAMKHSDVTCGIDAGD